MGKTISNMIIEELEDIKWQSYKDGDVEGAAVIQTAIDEIMLCR